MGDRVRFAVDEDAVGHVRLARPDKLNAMDEGLFAGLRSATAQAREAIAEGRCRAVLVSGEGRAFCAGLDVALFAEVAGAGEGLGGELGTPELLDTRIAELQDALTGFEDLPVPTVAALHGVAFGGGLQLALACHLRIAAPDTRLALFETRWGIIPDLGATYRLPRVVGLGRATDLAVSGRELDAETAAGWGLVDALLTADEDPHAAAQRYAAGLAGGPTVATGALPGLLRAALERTRAEALAAERRTQAGCLASADFAEAVAAAGAGRAAQFSGR